MSNAKVEAIWIKRVRRGLMDPVPHATAVAGRGLLGSANQGGWRQVTIIEREVWGELMRELDADIDPAARRANIMVSGLALENSRGRKLYIGEVEVEIMGETRPCERMDEALPGLRAAMRLSWRGGAFGVIRHGGIITLGDPVSWTPVMPASASASSLPSL